MRITKKRNTNKATKLKFWRRRTHLRHSFTVRTRQSVRLFCDLLSSAESISSSKKTRAHLFFMQGRVCVLPEDALACLCFTQPLSVSAPCPFCTASGLSPIQLSWSCSVHQTACSALATSQTRRLHSVLEESTARSVLSHCELDLAQHLTKSKSYHY